MSAQPPINGETTRGRYVTALYCDDIRREVGNKVSYMGTYGPVLYVAEIPAKLPKFCILLTAYTDMDAPFQSLTFRILFDDKLLSEAVMDLGVLGDLAENAAGEVERPAIMGYGAQFEIAPFTINHEGRIKIRVITERGEMKGPSIKIEKHALPPE